MKINDLSLTKLGDLLYHIKAILDIITYENKRINKMKDKIEERASLLSNLMPSEQKAIDAGIKVTKTSEGFNNYEGEVIVIEGNIKWRAVGVPEGSLYDKIEGSFNKVSYIEFYPLNF